MRDLHVVGWEMVAEATAEVTVAATAEAAMGAVATVEATVAAGKVEAAKAVEMAEVTVAVKAVEVTAVEGKAVEVTVAGAMEGVVKVRTRKMLRSPPRAACVKDQVRR